MTRRAYDAATVRACLGARTMWHDVRVVEQTGSTSSDLAALARLGAAEGTAVVADHQITGRGRLDRSWHTPPGTGIAVSMLFRPTDVPVSRWPWLTLITGVAAAEAVRTVTGVPAVLKWPNDVMVEGRKLAGILAEVVPGGDSALVVGVGLNVSVEAGDLPPTATSLSLAGAVAPDRLEVLVELLRAVDRQYAGWRSDGGAESAAAAYRPLCATIGAEIRVTLPGGTVLDGRAVDVDDEGRLIVRTTAGDRALSVGDVVHVR